MLKKCSICLFILFLASKPLFAADDLMALQLMMRGSTPGDLNDGIVADEAINDDLQLKKNINFIERNAMAKSLRGSKDVIVDCGTGNQIFASGANLNGATIVNLSNNKNTTAVCNQKK